MSSYHRKRQRLMDYMGMPMDKSVQGIQTDKASADQNASRSIDTAGTSGAAAAAAAAAAAPAATPGASGTAAADADDHDHFPGTNGTAGADAPGTVSARGNAGAISNCGGDRDAASASLLDDAILASSLPSDTMAAILLLRQLYIKANPPTRPLVLKTQLYDVVNKRTVADRELDELRRTNQVRLLKLSTGSDDYAIMLTSDYVETANASCASATARQQAAQQQTQGTAARGTAPLEQLVKVFCNTVLPACTDVHVPISQLQQLLESTSRSSSQREQNAVDTLLAQGLLCRTHTDHSSLLFCVPHLGTFVKYLSSGRKEVVSWLSKRPHKDVAEKELLRSLKLRNSKLGILYHVKDMVGLGLLQQSQVASDTVYCLARRR